MGGSGALQGFNSLIQDPPKRQQEAERNDADDQPAQEQERGIELFLLDAPGVGQAELFVDELGDKVFGRQLGQRLCVGRQREARAAAGVQPGGVEQLPGPVVSQDDLSARFRNGQQYAQGQKDMDDEGNE
jgi:hypothetical protein